MIFQITLKRDASDVWYTNNAASSFHNELWITVSHHSGDIKNFRSGIRFSTLQWIYFLLYDLLDLILTENCNFSQKSV